MVECVVKKNEIYRVTVDDLGHMGEGVAHIEGITLFIPGGLIGEEIEVKIIKVRQNKGIAYGKIVNILQVSPERIEPACDLKQCGGCDLHHMSYREQLRFKGQVVASNLKRIGGIDTEVLPALGSSSQHHYRNKTSIPIRESQQFSAIEAGYFARRSHRIIPFKTCLIHPAINDRIKEVLLEWMIQYHIGAYNEVKHIGRIRHLMIRHGAGEVMVVVVSRTKKVNYTQKLVERLRGQFPEITSIILNINPDRGNAILGGEHQVLYGKKTITATIDQLQFEIGPDTFFQINSDQIKPLYQTAVDFARLTGGELVIDAYCGVGSISLFLAQHVKKVIGIESSSASIEAANRNKVINKLEDTEFITGAAEVVMPELYQKGVRPDLIVMDPPRKGCDERFLNAAVGMAPKKMVYISCHPGTLARDLKYLNQNGYRTVKVQPVDLFPFTHHIESVALIERID